MFLEKLFRLYIYYLFPVLIIILGILYSIDYGEQTSVMSILRNKLTIICLMLASVYPSIYLAARAIDDDKWVRLIVAMVTIGSMLYIAIAESKAIVYLFSW